mmetsp:Transcript_49333/g.152110  ORF Transcript_49333/g.152110 Transcript_49333/m.152110 type:complete len:83 (-) Transcript_49333:481-729(-)
MSRHTSQGNFWGRASMSHRARKVWQVALLAAFFKRQLHLASMTNRQDVDKLHEVDISSRGQWQTVASGGSWNPERGNPIDKH